MNILKKLAVILVLSVFYSGFASAASYDFLTKDQKMAAIDSLRNYLAEAGLSQAPQSQVENSANGLSAGATNLPGGGGYNQRQVSPFTCIDEHEYNCETQRLMYDIQNRRQPVLEADGKHKVTIYFDNDFAYPVRGEGEQFKSVAKEDQLALESEIYERYLGQNYSSYSPEFVNVSQFSVGIAVWVTSSDELLPFLNESRIKGIYHVANGDYEVAH